MIDKNKSPKKTAGYVSGGSINLCPKCKKANAHLGGKNTYVSKSVVGAVRVMPTIDFINQAIALGFTRKDIAKKYNLPLRTLSDIIYDHKKKNNGR